MASFKASLRVLLPEVTGNHSSAQEFHAIHIGTLTLDVFGAHVNNALKAVAGADGGRGHTVLARACFGNDARLAHALGQHGLSNGVVDFVRARVVQVFALQIDLCATHFTAHAGSVVNGGGRPTKCASSYWNSAKNSGSFWYLA